jgi:hypothetical protein
MKRVATDKDFRIEIKLIYFVIINKKLIYLLFFATASTICLSLLT